MSMVYPCRKYDWIVKGGEEVRIDQRIEQLFDVMNGLMHRQPGAAAHSLQVCWAPLTLPLCLPMFYSLRHACTFPTVCE